MTPAQFRALVIFSVVTGLVGDFVDTLVCPRPISKSPSPVGGRYWPLPTFRRSVDAFVPMGWRVSTDPWLGGPEIHLPPLMQSSPGTPDTQGYAERAAELIPRYESLSFVEHHQAELHLLPKTPGRILDIGSGTGVDAAWFAEQGHSVVAVEPTAAFRTAAMHLHPSPSIEWLDDALPGLDLVLRRGQRFDTIMLSAVWMHLDEAERGMGMPRLASLLAPRGVMVLSLRHGPVPAGRRMFPVSGEETIGLARQHGLRAVLDVQTESLQPLNRAAGVTWTRLAFRHEARRVTPTPTLPASAED